MSALSEGVLARYSNRPYHEHVLQGIAGFDLKIARFAGQQREIIFAIIHGQNTLAGLRVRNVRRTCNAGVWLGLETRPLITVPVPPLRTCT